MIKKYGNPSADRTIIFLHANAYSADTYQFFLNKFKEYRIITWNLRPMWDGDFNSFESWQTLVEDVIEQINNIPDLNTFTIMGQSLGGVLSMFVTKVFGERIESMIMIDPVFLPRKLFLIKSLAPKSYMYRAPIVKKALKRKDDFENLEEAKNYFKGKYFFQQFTQQAQQDFLRYGLKKIDDHLTLHFPKKWEAKIYATVLNPWKQFKKIATPTLFLRAQNSDVIHDKSWKIIKSMANTYVICKQINDSGHLIIQEKPNESFLEIIEFLNTTV